MTAGSFRNRLRGQLFRESLKQQLTLAKKSGDHQFVVRYGSKDDAYARITIGDTAPKNETKCKNNILSRADVRETLKEFMKEGRSRFFDLHNLNQSHSADSYFIFYKNSLCDLKAVARASLGPRLRGSLAHSPTVAQAVAGLGFTYVHFTVDSPEDSKTIHLTETRGQERDGLRYGRSGEGENHKRLRLWVKDNPAKVMKGLVVAKTRTEVPLLSGDRVDVIYYWKGNALAIEVKSIDSNKDDLKRGVYQCVKYENVLRAQYDAKNKRRVVSSLLVTQNKLDDRLINLAKKLNIEHNVVSLN